MTLVIGLALTVLAVVRRMRRHQPGGFQAFDVILILILGIALIVGSFIGLQRAM